VVPFLVPFALAFGGQPQAYVQAASIAAQHIAVAEGEAPSDESDLLIDQYHDEMFARRFQDALKTADRIKIRSDKKVGQAVVLAMRASALFGLKKDKEARQLVASAERIAPREPLMLSMLFMGGSASGRNDVAADALDRLIAIAPDEARALDEDLVYRFLREEPEGNEKRNEDRRIALARMGFGGSTGDTLTFSAVKILLKRDDLAGAVELLHYINDIDLFEEMLTAKRYAVLWPTLERLGGAHLQKITTAALADAKSEYDEQPENAERLDTLIDALSDAGFLDEAIALRSKFPATPETMALIDQRTGWAIDTLADVLNYADRGDEADRLYTLLNDTPMEQGSWRVGTMINHAAMMMQNRKFERALALLGRAEEAASKVGNDYSRQLVRRLKYCTLSRLGRTAEANAFRPDLLSHAADAPGPTIEALLCAGEVDEAEKLFLTSVQEERLHRNFIALLAAKSLAHDNPSLQTILWREFRKRPAVDTEFNRIGRDLPEELRELPPEKQRQASSGALLPLHN
jgi:tetratricopeptide (TPR) repeat protein